MIVTLSILIWSIVGSIWLLVGATRTLIYHEPLSVWAHRILPPLFLGLAIWPACWLGVRAAIASDDYGMAYQLVCVFLFPPVFAYLAHRLTMREDREA